MLHNVVKYEFKALAIALELLWYSCYVVRVWLSLTDKGYVAFLLFIVVATHNLNHVFNHFERIKLGKATRCPNATQLCINLRVKSDSLNCVELFSDPQESTVQSFLKISRDLDVFEILPE